MLVYQHTSQTASITWFYICTHVPNILFYMVLHMRTRPKHPLLHGFTYAHTSQTSSITWFYICTHVHQLCNRRCSFKAAQRTNVLYTHTQYSNMYQCYVHPMNVWYIKRILMFLVQLPLVLATTGILLL